MNSDGNKDEKEEEKNTNKSIVDEPAQIRETIPAWLSCKFRLDKFNNKEQTFTITGCINVFFQMDKLFDMSILDLNDTAVLQSPNSNYQPSIKKISKIRKLTLENSDNINVDDIGKTIVYSNNYNEKIIKIVNLKESVMSFYLPINASKMFDENSLHSLEHNSNPALYYNKEKKLAHIQYNITATLFEHLDLEDFPFDRQILNIKLKWNSIYYHLLNWSNSKDNQIGAELFKEYMDQNQTLYNLYYVNPLRVCVCEELRSEIDMLQPWIDLNYTGQHDQFALIRLRIKRNPTNFCFTVLVPFFIIVSCSFTIFAIDSDSIADRLVVSVTILLTFTAFQNMVDTELPKTSDTYFIDKYILCAYGIQGIIISGACLLPTIVNSFIDDHSTYLVIELIWMICIVSIWIAISVYYVMKAKNVQKDQTSDDKFWETRAMHQKEHWTNSSNEQTTFRDYPVNSVTTKNTNDKHDTKMVESYKSPLIQK